MGNFEMGNFLYKLTYIILAISSYKVDLFCLLSNNCRSNERETISKYTNKFVNCSGH